MDIAETEGGYSRFSTSDIRVTFSCIDSRGEHEQGNVTIWETTLQRGQQLTDWLAEVGRQLQPGEVRQ